MNPSVDRIKARFASAFVRAEVIWGETTAYIRPEAVLDMVKYLHDGQRKIDRWTAQHRVATVLFDDASAFDNANTIEELQRLQR